MATTGSAAARGRGGHGEEAPTRGLMTHRQVLRALPGLLLGLFAAIVSSTIVTSALPEIINDLGGGQSAYTWVVTASLLAMTATTPLWGKLADRHSKKVLVQTALLVYITGSMAAGLAPDAGTLIAARAVQGAGAGGLSALAQIIMAVMVSPRDRGRYEGYVGGTFAVATVGGPLLGGVITDTGWLGWRWCLLVGVPFAAVALVVLRRSLDLPVPPRQGTGVDWAGAFLVTETVCLLLIWVTFAGDRYAWLSWQTCVMVGGSVLFALVFLRVESRAGDPVVPLRLFRDRTIALASLASLFVGVVMFAGAVFFSQYFELAQGKSPTVSGVMTIPVLAGLCVASTVSGRFITRTGRWKGWLLAGAVLLTVGLVLLGTLRQDTPYARLAAFMVLTGCGVGIMMQNLVLCAQNQVGPSEIGSASSTVTFFRSLGGAVGVPVLGSVLSSRTGNHARESIGSLDPFDRLVAGTASTDGALPDPGALPATVRNWLERAYGHGIGDIFLYCSPLACVAFAVILFIRETPLRASHGPDRQAGDAERVPAVLTGAR